MRIAKICGVLAALALCPPALLAQRTQPGDQQQTPVPAYSTPLGSVLGSSDSGGSQPQALNPDTTPLTGARELSLGTPTESRTYWEPHFYVTQTADSNPVGGAGKSWASYTSLLGGLDLHAVSAKSDFALMYSGGGTISNDGNIGNSAIQQFGISEKISGRRTSLSLFDQLGLIPEASYGYGGAGMNLPVGNLLGLQTGFLPGQTILTLRGQRLTNSSAAEIDRGLSERDSLTLTAGYSLMHYFNLSLLDFNDIIVQAGYNRQVTRENTIAFLYLFNDYRFSGYGEAIQDHSVQLSFGRKLTGRLALRAAGGPELALFHLNTTVGAFGVPAAPPHNRLYGAGNVGLTYQLRRTGLGLAYNHGISGGSGVFAGATTDQISGYLNQTLSRASAAGLNFGFSRNRAIGSLNPANQNQVYDYWFGGVNWNHPFSRTANLTVGYQVDYQAANSGFCIGVECGQHFVRHQISTTFGWRSRPLVF